MVYSLKKGRPLLKLIQNKGKKPERVYPTTETCCFEEEVPSFMLYVPKDALLIHLLNKKVDGGHGGGVSDWKIQRKDGSPSVMNW